MLDFRNSTEEIVETFEQFYSCTVAPPTDPNILWDTRRLLDSHDVLRDGEITAAMRALLDAAGSQEQRSPPPMPRSARAASGSRRSPMRSAASSATR